MMMSVAPRTLLPAMALTFLAVAPLVLHSTTGRGAAVHGRSESPPSAQSDPAGGAIVARLSTSAINTLLRQKGYTRIGKVKLTSGAYTVRARPPRSSGQAHCRPVERQDIARIGSALGPRAAISMAVAPASATHHSSAAAALSTNISPSRM